jgi:8-oxo-dGTP diphosphatase
MCWMDSKLLLVNHRGLYGHDFWAPPGGGVDFGISAAMSLKKEFEEETGLVVDVGAQQFTCEFIKPPLHAFELFFDVTRLSGQLWTGKDPEMGSDAQIIEDVLYLSFQEIADLPAEHKHGIFKIARTAENFTALKGYFKI